MLKKMPPWSKSFLFSKIYLKSKCAHIARFHRFKTYAWNKHFGNSICVPYISLFLISMDFFNTKKVYLVFVFSSCSLHLSIHYKQFPYKAVIYVLLNANMMYKSVTCRLLDPSGWKKVSKLDLLAPLRQWRWQLFPDRSQHSPTSRG